VIPAHVGDFTKAKQDYISTFRLFAPETFDAANTPARFAASYSVEFLQYLFQEPNLPKLYVTFAKLA